MIRKSRFLALFLFSGFGSFAQPSGLNLRQCIETALSANLSMKLGQATIESNRISLSQSKVNRYPSLNAGASQSVNFGRSVNPYDNTVVANQQVNSNNLSLSANVNLFNGFQNSHTIQQRGLNLKASEQDLGTTRNNIVLGVVESYANVLTNKAILESSKAQAEATRAQIDRTDKLVQAGRLPVTNLYDLKSQLATEETNIVLAENNLDLARLSLAQWMQVDPSQIGDLSEPTMVVEEAPEKSPQEVYSSAENAQPQIQAARTRVLSAAKGVDIARGGLYPSLNLQAGLFTNYSSIAQKFIPGAPLSTPRYQTVDLFQVTDTAGNVFPIRIQQKITTGEGRFENLTFADQLQNNLRKGFTFNLSIPIFNNFQSRNAVESARIAQKQAEIQLEQTKNQLRQTIETAVANEKAARNRLKAVEKQIASLEETFRSVEQRYNLGVLNTVDYLMAKNNLNRAKIDKTRFRYDFFIRRALVDFYLGKELNFN